MQKNTHTHTRSPTSEYPIVAFSKNATIISNLPHHFLRKLTYSNSFYLMGKILVVRLIQCDLYLNKYCTCFSNISSSLFYKFFLPQTPPKSDKDEDDIEG